MAPVVLVGGLFLAGQAAAETSGPHVNQAGKSDFWPANIETEIEITANVEREYNVDLDRSEEADVGVFEPEVALTFSHESPEGYVAAVGVTLIREQFFLDQADEEDSVWKLELEKLLFGASDVLVEGLTFEVGRQKLRDRPREWLVSETLDHVRLIFEHESFFIDASVSREKLFPFDLLNHEERPTINNYMLFAEIPVMQDVTVGGYSILRDDRSGEEGELLFVGVRSRGRIADALAFWLDTGHVTGHVTGDAGRIDVSGFAFDVGVTAFLDLPLHPTVTLAYAWGGGDGNPDDGTDHAYRQTGLHENEGRFGGIVNFKYYGLALDPELRNIEIYTAGLGFGAGTDQSIDIVYHHYRLARAAEEFDTGRVEGDLILGRKNLGHEVDVILGAREIGGLPWLGAKVAGGYFWSGPAFAAPTNDNAAFAQVEVIATF